MASELIGEDTQFLAEVSSRKADTQTFRIVFHGPYSELEIPEKGSEITFVTTSAHVAQVLDATLVLEEDGIMGTLTVNATTSVTGAAEGLEAKFEQIDIDFAETTQPIEFHPDFLSRVQSSAEEAAMKAWLKFKASPLSVRLEKKYLDNPDDPDSTVESLPSVLGDWADLYNRGIETYVTHLPVVTRTREYDARPMGLGEDLDMKESPPSSGCTPPSGYGEWLKTCDKVSYTSTTGKWQRTEQWTCAAEWPDLLYGGSSS